MPSRKKARAKTPPGLARRGDVFWYRFRVNGRLCQGSLQTADLAVAVERLERQRLVEEAEGGGRVRAALDEYLDYRRDRREVKERTVRTIYDHVDRFLHESGITHMPQITAGEVERFYGIIRQEASEHTAHKHIHDLRRFLRWCVEKNLLRDNPADGIRLARLVETPRKRFLTKDETDRLFEAVWSLGRDDIEYLLYCCLHAGMRLDEVINSQPSWFDLGAGTCGVVNVQPVQRGDHHWEPKDRQKRSIPLTRAFRAFLDLYMRPDDPWMLRPEREPGKWRYRFDPRKGFQAVRELADVQCSVHDLRRTFASRLASNGVDLFRVARWLGDGIKVVERHYAHLIPSAGEEIERGL